MLHGSYYCEYPLKTCFFEISKKNVSKILKTTMARVSGNHGLPARPFQSLWYVLSEGSSRAFCLAGCDNSLQAAQAGLVTYPSYRAWPPRLSEDWGQSSHTLWVDSKWERFCFRPRPPLLGFLSVNPAQFFEGVFSFFFGVRT